MIMIRKRIHISRTSAACALALAALAFHGVPSALAQDARYRFTIDERSSLSWWQISPHLNHLWATTCPEEPSWQPGDERSPGWAWDAKRVPKGGHSNTVDTIHVPVYPRPAGMAQPICSPAVRGEIVAADTAGWLGVRGLVLIRADRFITGLTWRDAYATKAVLQANRYPDVRFEIDSLMDVQRGDTVTAKAVGRFVLHGVKTPMAVPVRAWREAGGVRVTGKFMMSPTKLVEDYGISRLALGLGVGTGIWRYLHLGFDVLLNHTTQTGS